jgi:predicted regulator of Ras-like GTPase activity (Roadblock/LC7/MglB family)
MPTLPQLIDEDIRQFDAALEDLLSKSEAASALIIDKGGFLIGQCGDTRRFDTTTLGALAAAMYAATQGIAGLVQEDSFSNVYQQGQKHSLLVSNVDEHCLLVVIFGAGGSVGAVKYYATLAISQIAEQLKIAHNRAPGEGLDLSELNVADTRDFFAQKSQSAEGLSPDDPAAKLQKMKKLLASGLITEEDFEFTKRKILQEM